MDDDPIPLLICDNEFLDIANGDPEAAKLKLSICNLHQACNDEVNKKFPLLMPSKAPDNKQDSPSQDKPRSSRDQSKSQEFIV